MRYNLSWYDKIDYLIQTPICVEKSEIFLELFGNSLVRESTAEYLRARSEVLIKYCDFI